MPATDGLYAGKFRSCISGSAKRQRGPAPGFPIQKQRAIDFARTWTIEVIGPLPIDRIERRMALSRDVPGIECLMSFTVYGKNPCGGHSEFERVTAAGAVFKAADLVGDGWSGVHISDAKNKIYWPARFNRIPDRFSHVAVVSKPNA
jgi:hypothetical protein